MPDYAHPLLGTKSDSVDLRPIHRHRHPVSPLEKLDRAEEIPPIFNRHALDRSILAYCAIKQCHIIT
jgi:hypothetical protein